MTRQSQSYAYGQPAKRSSPGSYTSKKPSNITRVHRKTYPEPPSQKAKGKKRALQVGDKKTASLSRGSSQRIPNRHPAPTRNRIRIQSGLDESEELQVVKNAQLSIQRNPGPSLGAGASRYKQLTASITGMSLISHHIVLGNREDAANADGLHRIGVTHVLNAAAVQVPNHHPMEFSYLSLKVQDNPEEDLMRHRENAVGFIRHVEKLNGRVLVHCIAGVSRSVSLVIMHLMSTHQMYLRVAYDHIKSIRPFIAPNTGFLLQLAKNEIELYGVTTVASAPEWNFYEWNAIKHHTEKYEPVTASSGGGGCILL